MSQRRPVNMKETVNERANLSGVFDALDMKIENPSVKNVFEFLRRTGVDNRTAKKISAGYMAYKSGRVDKEKAALAIMESLTEATVISWKEWTSNDIKNWKELPSNVQSIFNKADSIVMAGSQEMIGHIGRKAIFSALVSLSGKKATIKSMGWNYGGSKSSWERGMNEAFFITLDGSVLHSGKGSSTMGFAPLKKVKKSEYVYFNSMKDAERVISNMKKNPGSKGDSDMKINKVDTLPRGAQLDEEQVGKTKGRAGFPGKTRVRPTNGGQRLGSTKPTKPENRKAAKATQQRSTKMSEELGKSKEYDAYFDLMLKKHGVSSPNEFKSDEEKKKFFDKVDAGWKADKEVDETTTNASVQGYNSPGAFSRNEKDAKKRQANLTKIAHGTLAKSINERFSAQHQKEFQRIADEIAQNMFKMDSSGTTKQYENAVLRCMLYMTHDESNPNYKNFEKFMPKKYDKSLFNSGGGNMNDIPWMGETDAVRRTVISRAVNKLKSKNESIKSCSCGCGTCDEAKRGPKSTAEKHQLKIAKDTVKNPAKGLLGGPSEKEAIEILKSKFGYSTSDIKKLQAEALELQEAMAVKGKFSKDHLDQLRKEYGKIKKVDPSSPTYKKILAFLDKLPQPHLKQLADAKPPVPFISGLARNRVKKNESKDQLEQEISKLNESLNEVAEYAITYYNGNTNLDGYGKRFRSTGDAIADATKNAPKGATHVSLHVTSRGVGRLVVNKKKLNEGMNLNQIKKAIDSGKKVHWSHKGYTVKKDKNGKYNIIHTNGSAIGLTHKDGKTLNGNPNEFFLAESSGCGWMSASNSMNEAMKEPPRGNQIPSSVITSVAKLTDVNDHNQARVELSKAIEVALNGTSISPKGIKSLVTSYEAILKAHRKIGGMPPALMKKRNELDKILYDLLTLIPNGKAAKMAL